MPYHPRYVMNQLARGRPMPTGSPDPDLARALEQLSVLAIEQAIGQGARPDSCDPRGRSALHVLFDHAFAGDRLTVHPQRLMACCRVVLRAGADPMRAHPATGQSALYRTAALAGHPMGRAWWHFLQEQRRGDWRAPGGRGLPSALAAWHAKAPIDLREHLPPLGAHETPDPLDAPVIRARRLPGA